MELFHENLQIQVPTFDGIGKYVLSTLLESSLSVLGVLQVVSQCLKISQKVSFLPITYK